MRINQFIALATGMSRRAADKVIADGRIYVNGSIGRTGQQILDSDKVTLDNKPIAVSKTATIILNKPVGYVCSRAGQGSQTIYDLLPAKLHSLKAVGRLDQDSSGLILLTNDGQLAHTLTHPSFQKEKVYEVELNKPLRPQDKLKIEQGIRLEDGISKLKLSSIEQSTYEVRMHEGRNRQIRRTFAAVAYKVIKLNRTQFGDHKLDKLQSGKFLQI